jgi:hypothetical protein
VLPVHHNIAGLLLEALSGPPQAPVNLVKNSVRCASMHAPLSGLSFLHIKHKQFTFINTLPFRKKTKKQSKWRNHCWCACYSRWLLCTPHLLLDAEHLVKSAAGGRQRPGKGDLRLRTALGCVLCVFSKLVLLHGGSMFDSNGSGCCPP